MRAKPAIAILALFGAAGCGALTPRAAGRPPLENDGEVFLYLQPASDAASRLQVLLASMSAIRSDGTAVPLELLVKELPGAGAGRQRLLARGELPPGTYRGLEVNVTRASVTTPEGPAQLLVQGPATVAAPFQVRAQRGTILTLALDAEGSIQAQHAFSPRFAVSVPTRSMPQLYAVTSNTGGNDLTLFDKRRREVFAAVPTGREPEGVALSPDLSRMYVAISGEGQVAVFDLSTTEPLPAIRLTAGDRPRELAVSPDGRVLLVLNEGSSSLAFIDVSSGTELGRVPTGNVPVSLLVDRSFRRAYVLNQGSSTITVVDVPTRAVAATIGTDPVPVRAQLNRAGNRLYVVHEASPQMLVLSLPDMSLISRITIGMGAATLKVDSRSDLIYLAKRGDPRIYVYDPFSLIPVDFFDLPAGATWLAIDDAENTLLALMPSRRSVVVVDLPSRRPVGIAEVGEEPYMVTVAGERF
jgi:YVTN family beta-propeller protein